MALAYTADLSRPATVPAHLDVRVFVTRNDNKNLTAEDLETLETQTHRAARAVDRPGHRREAQLAARRQRARRGEDRAAVERGAGEGSRRRQGAQEQTRSGPDGSAARSKSHGVPPPDPASPSPRLGAVSRGKHTPRARGN